MMTLMWWLLWACAVPMAVIVLAMRLLGQRVWIRRLPGPVPPLRLVAAVEPVRELEAAS